MALPPASTLYPLGLSPEDAERLPYYRHLLAALAGSATACALLDAITAERRNPILVPDVLHLLALRGRAPFAELYREREDLTPEEWAGRLVAALERDPSPVEAELGRTVQTNEVGRSAIIARILAGLAQRGHRDVHLVDVGASMGLNLHPDRLHHGGEPGDPLALRPEDRGSLGPAPLPRIHERVGLERTPLSPEDPADVEWLRACLWPEDTERAARFEAVLAARTAWPPVRLVRGDAARDLPALLDSLTPGPTPVVLHTWVAAYFDAETQRSVAATMAERVGRGAVWAYVEFPPLVRALAPPVAPEGPAGASQVVVADGGPARHWGWVHPHGRWVDLATPRTD